MIHSIVASLSIACLYALWIFASYVYNKIALYSNKIALYSVLHTFSITDPMKVTESDYA